MVAMFGAASPADISLNKYSLEFQYEELRRATQSFDASMRLGKGAFGAVYRGHRGDGTEVAVKALEVPAEGGFEEEVRVLSKFRHPNLVILMGFARNGLQRFLVYELLEGGDVYRRLQRSVLEGLPYPWRSRVSTAYDAACGLSHLHNSDPEAFHRDIKSANILLDRNGTAKMADFGLACMSLSGPLRVEMASGTPGYACPQYVRSHVVTEGSEVYSFGVVLLELLTASPPAWQVRGAAGSEYSFLVSAVNGDLRKALSLVDRRARWPQQVSQAMANLAVLCTSASESKRPHFAELVAQLRPLRDAPDSPEPSAHGVVYAPAAEVPPLHVTPCPALQRPMTPIAGVTPRSAGDGVLLWALECTFVEGSAAVTNLPRCMRSLLHLGAPEAASATAFRVGRAVQEEFFATMLPIDEFRGLVSREHFQIWAVKVAGPRTDGRSPHTFLLQNNSANGTSVNGMLLDAPGRHAQIREGDLVGLGRVVSSSGCMHFVPFIQFRFSLASSALCDAGTEEICLPEEDAPRVATPPPVEAPGADFDFPGPDDGPPAPPPPPPRAATAADAGVGQECTSLLGDVEPRFLLEIAGSGIREDAAMEMRCIAHGPLLGAPPGTPFAPLTIGRAHGTRFWQRLLRDEAFQALSRDHLVLEACGEGLGAVAVRSLSSLRPVRVRDGTAGAEEAEQAKKLAPGAPRELRHNDVIVLSASRTAGLNFTFVDLLAPPPDMAPGARAPPEAAESDGSGAAAEGAQEASHGVVAAGGA